MRRSVRAMATLAAATVVVVPLAGGLWAGCSGHTSGSSSPPGVSIDGLAVAAPVAGARVRSFRVDVTTRALTLLGEVRTDAQGRFAATLEGPGPFLLLADGGAYADEATGGSVSLATVLAPATLDDARPGTLEALLGPDVVGPVPVTLSPLSTLAARRASEASRTDGAALSEAGLTAAARTLGQTLGVGSVDVRQLVPLDLTARAVTAQEAATPAGVMGALLAALSKEAQTLALSPPTALVDALVQDYRDGLFNGLGYGASAGEAAPVPVGAGVLPAGATRGALAQALDLFLADSTRNASGTTPSTYAGLTSWLSTRVDAAPVNAAPSFAVVPDQTVDNSGTKTVTLAAITAGTAAEDGSQAVTLSADSTAPALLGALSVGPVQAGSAVLSFTPTAGATGTATVTITVRDTGGTQGGGLDTLRRTFLVTVTQASAPPPPPPPPPPPSGPFVQQPALSPSFGLDAGDRAGGVLLHSGELVVSRTDLVVRGRGLDFRFTRTYRSGDDQARPLGYGWDANVFARVAEDATTGDVAFHDGTARVDTFTNAGGGVYTAPAGRYARLVKSAGELVLREPDGTKLTFDDASGRLTRVEDRAGNVQTYAYDVNGRLQTITDDLGRTIAFGHDASDRLETIVDFTGREVRFTYDAAGDLVEARSPLVVGTPNGNDFAAGKRERYVYDAAQGDARLRHNLVGVIRPNEVEAGATTRAMTTTYGTSGHVLDRVIAQAIGGTNASGVAAGGALSYAYDFAPTGGPAGTTERTVVTDRRGNVTTYFHDAAGHCLRVVEPGALTTELSHDADGQLTRLVRPLGNRVDRAYDAGNPDRLQQGNLLSVTFVPDVARAGAQAQLRWTYTYEPLFNRPLTATSPRGTDATYVPQNGGAQSAARYTTTWTYDWQEAAVAPPEAATWGIAVPGALLNQGDVNFDGRTDQAMGNVVRTQAPTVTLAAGSRQALAEGDTAQDVVELRQWNDLGQLTLREDARGNQTTFEYFPEQDPDGDGLDLTPGRDPDTGGYPFRVVVDAAAGPRRQDTAAPVASTRTFQRDRRGNATSTTDPRGGVSLATFNALDQAVQREAPKVDPSQANGFRTRFAYDANDALVSVARESWTTSPTTHLPQLVVAHPWFTDTVVYDILGQRVEETRDATRDAAIPASAQPELLTTRLRYDSTGNLVRVERPLAVAGTEPENVVTATYDARDLRVTTTRGGASPLAATVTYGFDANGNLVAVTDAQDDDAAPGGEATTLAYDGFDRLVGVTDALGNQATRAYDPEGRPTRVERRGNAAQGGPIVLLAGTSLAYDELGRVIQVGRDLFVPAGVALQGNYGADPALTEGPFLGGPADGALNERLEYDARGRLTFRTRDNGATTSFVHDGADRLLQETLPLADTSANDQRTTYEYDDAGALTRRVDQHVDARAAGAIAPIVVETFYVRDALGRVARVTGALGHTRYAEYDSLGDVVSTYDARGPSIADPLGLYTAGNINDRGNAVRYAYDGARRRWLTVQELTTTGDGGDPLDTTNAFNADGLTSTLATWDADGRLASLVDDNGNATTHAYDALDRLTGVTQPDGGARSYVYDRDDHLTQLTDEDGTVHALAHDALGRALTRTMTAAGRTIGGTAPALPVLVGTTRQTFAWDGLSRLIAATDENEPGDATDDWTVVTRYDSLGRVLEEVQGGRAVSNSYVGDVRARLYYPVNPSPAATSSRIVEYGHDALDRLTSLQNTTTFSFTFAPVGLGPAAGASSPSFTASFYYGDTTSTTGLTQPGQATAAGLGAGAVAPPAPRGPSSDCVFELGSGDYAGSEGGIVDVTVQRSACLSVSNVRVRERTQLAPTDVCSEYSTPGPGVVITVDATLDDTLAPTQTVQRSLGAPAVDTTYQRTREGQVTDVTHVKTFEWEIFAVDVGSQGAAVAIDQDVTSLVGGPSFGTGDRKVLDGALRAREIRDNPGGTLKTQINFTSSDVPLAGVLQHNDSTSPAPADYRPGTGLRTRDAGFFYQWDALGRLRVVRRASDQSLVVAVYAYDARGRRVARTVTNATPFNGATRTYHDGARAIEDTTVAGGADTGVARQLIHGRGGVHAIDVDQVGGDGVPESLLALLRDHLGSPVELRALNNGGAFAPGQAVEAYRYDYRGQTTIVDPATGNQRTASVVGNPIGFLGQRLDPETQKYYLDGRYYDPGFVGGGTFMNKPVPDGFGAIAASGDAADDETGAAIGAPDNDGDSWVDEMDADVSAWQGGD